MELQYDRNDISMDMDFHRYSDAGWSQDPDNSHSTFGFIFLNNCGVISWLSKHQAMVALSTTESEYIGLSLAGQHLAWLQTFFEDIGHPQKEPMILHCDNQAAIILSRDAQFLGPSTSNGSTILSEMTWWAKEMLSSAMFLPQTDILTKALTREQHWKFIQAMGLRLRSSGSVKYNNSELLWALLSNS